MLGSTVSTVVSFICEYYLTIIIVTVVTYVIYFLRRPKNLPPGPYGYPIIGSYLDLSIDLSTGFTQLGKKYGDIFTLWMGSNRYWVVLNSYDAIKEVYITRGADFSDREPTYDEEDTIFNAHYNEVYKESRKITAQFVRTFIRDKLDNTLQCQMDQVHQFISEHSLLGKPLDLRTYLSRVLGNVIFRIVFDKTFKHGDAEADLLYSKLRKWFMTGFEIEALEYIPLSGSLTSSKTKQFDELQGNLETLVGNYVDEHVSTFQEDSIRDVVDAYIKVDGLNKFGRRKMINTFMTLLPDSAATSVFTGLFLFIYLLNFPKYQDAIAKEIDNVKGQNGRVSIDDRSNMPVTESFIMEVFRKANPAPIGIQTKPLMDTQLRGYSIPKYMDIIPNYQGVHYDPVLFPEPESFKPERFIQDGKVRNLEGFIPFGMGRRMCVGEHLVRNNLFIILTSMVQRYRIKPGPGGTPSLNKDQSSVVGRPQKFNVILEERK